MLIAQMSGNFADVHRLVGERIDRFPTVYRSVVAQLLGWTACLTQNTEWLHTARTLLPGERGHGAYTTAATDLRVFDAAFRGDHAGAAAALVTHTRGFAGRPFTTSVGVATVALWCDDLDTARAIIDQTRTSGLSTSLGRAPAPTSRRSSPPPMATTPAPKTSPTKSSPSPHRKAWCRRSSARSRRSPPSTLTAPRTASCASPPPPPTSATRSATGSSSPAIRRRLDQLLADARASLGDGFDTAWTEGASLTWEETVAYAQRMRGERRRPAHGWNSLTPTELDIVALVTEGLTNPQIAERMFIETSTVKSHVHHIFTKLGIATRSELAATASRRDP